MKLYHKVIHTPTDEIAASIELGGLIPKVADVYKDLVPENIRGESVVWFTENRKLSDGEPCFEVDTKDLDRNKLHHTAVVYEADKELKWWVYQGEIPPQVIKRATEPLIKGE